MTPKQMAEMVKSSINIVEQAVKEIDGVIAMTNDMAVEDRLRKIQVDLRRAI